MYNERIPPPSVSSALEAIGMTPVVHLRKVVPPQSADVFVKLEYFNTTGSYKDRMALAMIEEAEARGALQPGMTVVEYTGGSTGSSLAFVCAVKGYRFRVVSSDAFAKEKLDTMTAFGAELHIVPSEGGKITPDDLPNDFSESEGELDVEKFIPANMPLPKALERIEEKLIRSALTRCDNIQSHAAKNLGITKSLIQHKMKKYNIVLQG